jgi:putative acetyltransferase
MIRTYQATDVDEVLGVWARASALAHPFLSQEFLESERRMIPDVYLPNAETWVCEASGHVVGFISLLGHEIGGIFVDPDVQRSGIGRALMGHARALRGELEVEVFARNLLGRAFYATLGFEVMHEEVHAETGFDVLRLRLPARRPMQPSGDDDG